MFSEHWAHVDSHTQRRPDAFYVKNRCDQSLEIDQRKRGERGNEREQQEIDAKHCKLRKIDENSDKFQFGQWTRTHSIGCDAMRSVDSDKFIRSHEEQSCELVPLKIVASVFYDLDIENYFYSEKKLPIRKQTKRDFTE